MSEQVDKLLSCVVSLIKDSDLAELIVKRLESLGYTPTEGDAWAIAFATKKVQNNIFNFCNITEIPDGLTETAVDMVCGEFLTTMRDIGKLDDTFNLEDAVKQVQTGDTSVTFSLEGTPEQRMNSLLQFLTHNGEVDFLCYRQIKW